MTQNVAGRIVLHGAYVSTLPTVHYQLQLRRRALYGEVSIYTEYNAMWCTQYALKLVWFGVLEVVCSFSCSRRTLLLGIAVVCVGGSRNMLGSSEAGTRYQIG